MKILDYALAGDIGTLKKAAPNVLLLAFILVPLGILTAMANNYFKKQTNLQLKKYYMNKVFHKNIAEFYKENNGKYISALTNDFAALETNLISGIYTIGNGIISFLVGIWVISTVDVRMLFFALIIIIVNLILSIIISKPAQRSYKERSDMFDNYTSYIKEVLSAFHIVKNYDLSKRVTDDYYAKSEAIQQKGFIIERMMTYIWALQNFTSNASMYGILCIIGYLALKGTVTPGGLILVVTGIQKMVFPLFDVSESLPKVFSSKGIIQKIEKTLENEYKHLETIDLPDFKKSIQFVDAEFHYEDDDQVILSNINLEFKKNGKYLIVGPSGGGKSTLLKLLRKYFNPTKGMIQIDGFDLKDIKREHYFSLIANIEQQVFIFEDTVKNNLTLYKEYSKEEIENAITAAGLKDFIKSLPNGLDTIIYDNGKNISGGERSRLVIARALLSKASILFMDEAFASLDMERAKAIEKTILGLKNITVINVSHIIFNDTKDLYDRVFTVRKEIM
jgi:ABC-type multidrug transport system fused ATPase/permease subunit